MSIDAMVKNGLRIGVMALAGALWAQPPAPPMPPMAGMRMAMGSGSFLGVNVVEIEAERARELKLSDEHGVEITRVEQESPAEKAGLKKGDVVLEYNGQRVEGTEQFIRFVRETPGGRTVKLTVWRSGATQTVEARIGTRKSRPDMPGMRGMGEMFEHFNVPVPDLPHPYMGMRSRMIGVEVEGVDGQLAQYFGVKEGVLVRAVIQDSPAEKAGLKAGDVITKVDGTAVESPRELTREVRSKEEKKAIALTLMRERREMTLTVTLEAKPRGLRRKEE